MTKIKIPKSEVIQMIKEEYSKKITEIKLRKRLRQINEEIGQMTSEENLDEVEAGGEGKVRSTGWTGEKNGDEKWTPKFQKKGSHLVEDEEIDMNEPNMEEPEMEQPEMEEPEMDDSEDIVIDDMSSDEDLELDISEILKKLGDAINDKIETSVDAKVSGDVTPDEIPSEEPIEGGEEFSSENGEGEEGEEGDESIMKEQDGVSVIQGQSPKNATPFDNGKAEIPATGKLVSESYKKRMQILSGIQRNDFND